MTIFKITKYYKGGSDIYYVKCDIMNDIILDGIGKQTPGGESLGFSIYYDEVEKIPSNAITFEYQKTMIYKWMIIKNHNFKVK